MNSDFKRSNAFLLEIILNIFIFALLLSVSLQMIMKAHSLTRQTRDLYQAVNICENIGDLFESGDGDFVLLQEAYPSSVATEDGLLFYFDSNFAACSAEEASYHVIAEYDESASLNGSKILITFYDANGEVLYESSSCHFLPAVPQSGRISQEVGA